MEHYNDSSAIEMEGFGFGRAVTQRGEKTGNIRMAVVRGISDIIKRDEAPKATELTDNRPKYNKQFASATAAAFAFWLIQKALSS